MRKMFAAAAAAPLLLLPICTWCTDVDGMGVKEYTHARCCCDNTQVQPLSCCGLLLVLLSCAVYHRWLALSLGHESAPL